MIMAENPLCEKCVMSNSFYQPETNEWITFGVAQTSPVSSVMLTEIILNILKKRLQGGINHRNLLHFYMFINDQTEFNHLLLTGKTSFRLKLLTCFIN